MMYVLDVLHNLLQISILTYTMGRILPAPLDWLQWVLNMAWNEHLFWDWTQLSSKMEQVSLYILRTYIEKTETEQKNKQKIHKYWRKKKWKGRKWSWTFWKCIYWPLQTPVHCWVIHFVYKYNQMLHTSSFGQHGMFSRLTAFLKARLKLSFPRRDHLPKKWHLLIQSP